MWVCYIHFPLATTLCDKVCQWLAEGRWFSPGTPVSSTNKTLTPWYNWNIVESGVNHHNQPTYPPIHLPLLKLIFFYLPKLHMCSCISPNGFTSKVICIRWPFPYIAIRKDYKPENNFISIKKENLKDGALHYHWIKNNSLSLNWF